MQNVGNAMFMDALKIGTSIAGIGGMGTGENSTLWGDIFNS